MTHQRRARIYIIGAGFAGVQVAQDIHQKGILGDVVAFLDDDATKIGKRIDGIPVLGPINDVVALREKTPADEALIAMPSVARERLKQIYLLLAKAEFGRIRILPSASHVIDGEAHLIQTREIDPEDLLGRNPVQINLRESLRYLRGKRVVITGAGGSIGSELARQLLAGGAQRLYLFGHGENSIYQIDRELRILQEEGVGDQATIVPVIGELQDRDYVNFIIKRLRADVVFHTAAHKHVPLMEANPVEAVKNNVFGTLNLVESARDAAVERLVMISTDKVVEPTSIYGASKRIAEDLVLSTSRTDARFMVVRFGNVLGSRGSILPLFRRQILKGGPVTITHQDTTRFFMTIPEAASLVLQAGGVGDSGQLYLLDMGTPVRIRDLAEQMIRFYGFEPGDDIALSYIGMRPGEKVEERLFDHNEVPAPTPYPRINRVRRTPPDRSSLEQLIDTLTPLCYFDPARAEDYRNRHVLRAAIAEYLPSVPTPDDEPEY
jgi:FlaA1/EpsC-like NDP-sugar epimerase